MNISKIYKYILLLISSLFISATLWINGALTDIPDQIIKPDETFSSINLTDFLAQGIDCDVFTISPVIATGSAQQPQNCTEYQGYSENMTGTLKFSFAGQSFFKHEEDYLIAYDESDNIVECASSSIDPFNNGDRLFFINIQGGSTSYPVKIEFYSGEHHQSYTIENAFIYTQDDNMGDARTPKILTVSPLSLDLNAEQVLTVAIADPAWIGNQCFTIDASGCTDNNTGTDQICFSVSNSSCVPNKHITDAINVSAIHRANDYIIANNTIETNGTVYYLAGDSIVLKPGFHATAGSSFIAAISNCAAQLKEENDTSLDKFNKHTSHALSSTALKNLEAIRLEVYPNLITQQASIQLNLPTSIPVYLSLFNHQGQAISSYLKGEQLESGTHYFQLSVANLSAGFYFLQLQTTKGVVTKKLVVQK